MSPFGPSAILRTLQLDAFDGKPILNSIETPPTAGFIALAREGMRLSLLHATPLSGPTGRFNCHGLVFGSRRTNIPPASVIDFDIDALLKRDGYEPVETIQVGDIVTYRKENGDIDHSGIVVSTSQIDPEPQVWSMWGALGEFEH